MISAPVAKGDAEALVSRIVGKHPLGSLEQIHPLKEKRLANARKSFANGMAQCEAPLAMIDSSFLQNGRSGVLLTNEMLYSSALPSPLPLREITSVVVDPRVGPRLLVNGQVVYSGRARSYWTLWSPEFWREVLTKLAQLAKTPFERTSKDDEAISVPSKSKAPVGSASSASVSLWEEQRAKRLATQSEIVRLRDAAFDGNELLVKAILCADFDVNTPLPNGDRLLVSVAQMGDARLQITKLLVDHGADVNSPISRMTLLQWITQDVFCDNEATIDYLKSKGAIARSAVGNSADALSEGTSPRGSGGAAETFGEKQPTKMELGEGIMILRFPHASIAQHQNHVELIRELHARGAFPALRVYALVPEASMFDNSRLIVLTGSMAEAQKVQNVYYAPEAESHVNRKLGGDWAAISAESTSDNVPMPGCRVDIPSFQRTVTQVLQGKYTIEQVV